MNALSTARSLWAKGIPVDVLADRPVIAPARWSRASRRYVPLSTDGDPTAFWLDWLSCQAQPSVVLPCGDEGVELVGRRREELEDLGHLLVEANDGVLLDMLDKSRTYELAGALGVPAPRTLTLRGRSDLGELGDFPFPCAMKPVHSHRYARAFPSGGKGGYLSDARQAVERLGPALDVGEPMLVTEVVEGTDECCDYYTYLDFAGEPLVEQTTMKLRQYPTRFGLGTYHISRWQPEVAELGLRFAQGVGLRGIGNVEFKRDRRDGVWKLIECNPRLTHPQALLTRLGADLGLLAYARLVSDPLRLAPRSEDEVGLLFAADDVRAFVRYHKDGELTVTPWLRSLARPQAHPWFDARDPRPSLMNLSQHGRRAIRKIGREVTGRPSRRSAAG